MSATVLRHAAILFAACCALALAGAPAAMAGTYRLDYGSGLGPAWSTASVHGLSASDNVVRASSSLVAAPGSFGALEFRLPPSDLRVVAGTIQLSHSLQSAGVVAQVRTGESGDIAYTGYGANAGRAVTFTGSMRTVQVGLRANQQGPFAGTNTVTLAGASFDVRDLSRPEVEIWSTPDPAAWQSPTGCVDVRLRATDDDSGIMSTTLRREDGALVDAWVATPEPGIRPGVDGRLPTICIPAAMRPHGVARYTFVATNAAGDGTSVTLPLRTDRVAPMIGDGPADRSVQEAPYSPATFSASDGDGAGIVRVEARVDGSVVATTRAADGRIALAGAPLGVGLHVVELTVTDAVGNASSVERRVEVVDTTAPTMERVTPGDEGSGDVTISLRARDDVSGIRASTWSVAINGAAVGGSGDAQGFAATVTALAPGLHQIEARVADLAGNMARMSFSYVVTAPTTMPGDIAAQVTQIVTSQAATAGAAAAAEAAASGEPGAAGATGAAGAIGAWIVRGGSVQATFGMPAEVTVFVARAGRAVAGRRVSVWRAGVEIAAATTGEDGLARVGYTAGDPGAHHVLVEGLPTLPLQVGVAPRVLLSSARTAKRGRMVRVTGRLQPALASVPVVVEARSGRGWFVVRRLRTTKGGAYATSFTANARGKFQLRARVAPRAGWSAATSSPRALTVR